MANYKIGITEAGDAGIDLSWESKLDAVDGAILITKKITEEFSAAVLRNKDKVIVHVTATGYGGTVVEPNVPPADSQISAALQLVRAGFPIERIVIRVDPIIPTAKGCIRAHNVISMAILLGFTRFRISMIDMYPHVIRRFLSAGLPLPYENGFAPLREDSRRVIRMVRSCKLFYQVLARCPEALRIETCAERIPEDVEYGVHRCGCISAYDMSLLGLDDSDADQTGYQRKDCMCYSGKVELLNGKKQCPYKCLYCYWK